MKITAELLRELGACGDPIRDFQRLFPVTEHPDGVTPTREVCEQHDEDFNWPWAVEVLLNTDGQNEHYKLTNGDAEFVRENSRQRRELRDKYYTDVREWQAKFDEAYEHPRSRSTDEARAAFNEFNTPYQARNEELLAATRKHTAGTFGELFTNHPELRRNGIDQVAARAAERAEAAAQQAVENAKYNLENMKSSIASYEETVQSYRDKLPGLEQAIADAEAALKIVSARALDRKLAVAKDAAVAAQTTLEQSQSKVAELEQAIAERDAADSTAVEIETSAADESAS